MNREIKFRAWLKDAEQFAKVRHISFFKGETVIKIYDQPVNEEIWFDLQDVELLQYTGLKDKNGIEVYEGDIVKCTRGCPHEVIYLQEYAGTYVGGMPAWCLSGIREGYAWTGCEEVIGNIYENPELLEESK